VSLIRVSAASIEHLDLEKASPPGDSARDRRVRRYGNVPLLSEYVCRLMNRAGCSAEARGASVSVKADGFLYMAASISD